LLAGSMVVVLSLSACAAARTGAPPATSALSTTTGAAAASPSAEASEPLRLVTLGDAYTAGTDTLAPKRDSWPAQLVAAMERGEVHLQLIANLAEASQTSQDVIRTQLPQVESLAPDVVTLQVGVNDIIDNDWRLDGARYEQSLDIILDQLLGLLGPGRIFVITTPDHTLTAWGGRWGPRDVGHAAVSQANDILAAVARERGITVIDISAVNERVTSDASLVIGAGPYPTAKQYAGWVEVIGPQMLRVLGTVGAG
jgi:lysophospholipase L1-like esterase